VLARPENPHPEQSWSGWGDPGAALTLPEGVRALLRDGLGVQSPGQPVPPLEEIELPQPHLPDAVLSELAAVVGADHVRSDREARLRHTRGKSTTDLLRLRRGDASAAPDLVVTPGSHEEVEQLLRLCAESQIGVVPFGGGTSVVGGLQPELGALQGMVAIDLRRMNALVALDEESRLAELEPGLRGPEAEALLSGRGYTIGHFPQSFEYATLGGFAATRSSGQASAGYGRFDEMVLGMRVATPAGTLKLGRAPRSAAGPDLRQLFLGSEGTLGVLTSLTLQVHPAPVVRVYDGWRFRSFAEGMRTLRQLVQDGPLPAVLRLSDETETALNLARPGALGATGSSGGCLAIVGYEGSEERVAAWWKEAVEVLRSAGATLEQGMGESWSQGRFRAPYLRDALLDAGALVETLETATFWSGVMPLYRAVSDALRESLTSQGTPPVILCHISHVYPAGASLYFTVACAQLEDPVQQWRTAKAAASDAILATGGSITHHHAVGIDHRPWFEREVGPIGMSMLRAVKRAVDPGGIMNPGVLL
jgi:alkyldihydroxyacetonephosphate synthase